MVSEIIAIFDVTVLASPEVDRMGDNKTIYITIYWSHCLAKQKHLKRNVGPGLVGEEEGNTTPKNACVHGRLNFGKIN